MSFAASLDFTWIALAPLLTLLLTAAFGLFAALWGFGSRPAAATSLIGLVTAGVFTFILSQNERHGVAGSGFGLNYLVDLPATAFHFVIIVGAILAVLIAYDYLEREIGRASCRERVH